MEKTVFLTNGAETIEHPDAKKKNLNTDLTAFTKIHSKMDHRPMYKYTIVKILEKTYMA